MSTVPNLKNGTYKYKGLVFTVQEQYVADGQIILETDSKTIRVNKSEASREFAKFKPAIKTEDGYKWGKSAYKNNAPAPLIAKDTPAGEFYQTRDLEKFVFNEKNRAINKAHVKNLMQSIEDNNLLYAQPILVNEIYEVIDGQHRLTAAKRLNESIYYIMWHGLSVDDAISLNINTKNWGYQDYLDHWVAQDNKEYIYFARYRSAYKMSFSLAIGLLFKGVSTVGGTNAKEVFNSGEFTADYRQYAERIGRLTGVLSRYGSFTNDRSFVRAIDLSIRVRGLDPFLLIKKVKLCPDKFTKCSDTDSYFRMLEDVVNYHGRGERIRLY